MVDLTDNKWRFCTGTLDQTEGLLNRIVIFVEDTRDGGLSVWLSGIGKRNTTGPGSDESHPGEEILPGSMSELPSDARLEGMCHCGAVRFQMLPPPKNKKYTAGIDLCTSCRLTTGFELSCWVSVPLTKVQMPDGSPLNLDTGTFKSYRSSSGVFRHFCGTCGATVLVAKDNQSWVDIAAGLLRAEEGARAERWLEWTEIGFPEEGTDQTLVRSLEKEFRAWGGKGAGPAP